MPNKRRLRILKTKDVMGYDLHITRAEFWAENQGHQISLEEWLALIEEDPELTLTGDDNSPYFAAWSGKSIHSEPWLNWVDGNIYSKNPDQAIILKMVSIAHRLQAQVQGEEGEIYDGGEEGVAAQTSFHLAESEFT